MLGNSGATFTFTDSLVEKTGGGTDLVEQARLCDMLGDVCPRVYSIGENSYVMERLTPLPRTARPDDTLRAVRVILETRVWPLIETLPVLEPQWVMELDMWLAARDHPRLRALLRGLYDVNRVVLPCVVHGDPTLANVMMRGEELVLIDPLPPRPYVPGLPEVDVGKLLQSCGGWEGVKSGQIAWTMPNLAGELIGHSTTSLWSARCYLWGAVHCARILPYATNNLRIQRWCREWIGYWTRESERAAGL